MRLCLIAAAAGVGSPVWAQEAIPFQERSAIEDSAPVEAMASPPLAAPSETIPQLSDLDQPATTLNEWMT